MSGAVFTSRRRIHTHKHTPRAQTGTTNTAPDRRKSSPHPSSPSAQIPIYHRSLPGSSPPPLPDSLSSNSGALGFHSDEHGKLFTVYCPLSPCFPPTASSRSPPLRRAGVLLSALPALFPALFSALRAVHFTTTRFLYPPPPSPPFSHPDAAVFSVTEGSGTRCSGSKCSSEIFFFFFFFLSF